MSIDGRMAILAIVAVLLAAATAAPGAPRKAHTVVLGAAKRVHYSSAGDPAGAAPGETELKIRALIVDGVVKEVEANGFRLAWQKEHIPGRQYIACFGKK